MGSVDVGRVHATASEVRYMFQLWGSTRSHWRKVKGKDALAGRNALLTELAAWLTAAGLRQDDEARAATSEETTC